MEPNLGLTLSMMPLSICLYSVIELILRSLMELQLLTSHVFRSSHANHHKFHKGLTTVDKLPPPPHHHRTNCQRTSRCFSEIVVPRPEL
ncbi:hypothetical protein ABKN59_009462 [Abortiporus biennis]